MPEERFPRGKTDRSLLATKYFNSDILGYPGTDKDQSLNMAKRKILV